MEKDFRSSRKYTPDELANLQIAYKFQDFCQDDYADYLSCVRVNLRALENVLVYTLPLSDYFTSCKLFRKQWLKCEDYRERQVFSELRRIFDSQRENS